MSGQAPTLADENDPATDDGDDESAPDLGDDVTVDDATDVLEQQANNDVPDDVDEATVELGDDDLGGGLFSGVEEGSSDDESDESDDESEGEGDGDDDVADGLDGNSAAMERSFNEGVGRALVIGLTDEDFDDSKHDKEGIQTEIAETAEAFRFGYFATQVVEEYVLSPADDDVNPVWGLLGVAIMLLGMAVWLRPDGDAAVDRAKNAAKNIAGGMK